MRCDGAEKPYNISMHQIAENITAPGDAGR